MSVFMIILGLLITALLAIGIVGGVILCVITVFRLISGKGDYQGKQVSDTKKVLLSIICVLNALSLLAGGFLGATVFLDHKEEIWNAVEQQSQQDNILPDFMQD